MITIRRARFSYVGTWNHGRHNIQFGGDSAGSSSTRSRRAIRAGRSHLPARRRSSIVNGVPAPGTGFDFADFLLGMPDQSAIAFWQRGQISAGDATGPVFHGRLEMSPRTLAQSGFALGIYVADHGKIRTAGESGCCARVYRGAPVVAQRSCGPADRRRISGFADSSGQARIRAAARDLRGGRFRRRRWWCAGYGVSTTRRFITGFAQSDGAAIAAFDESCRWRTARPIR